MERPLLVLIPGMMCDQHLFTSQLAALDSSARIQVADITRHETIEEISASILDFVDEPEFAVAGLSMGGIVAMEMVRQQPQRITRLGLFNTNHLADTDDKREIRCQQIEKVRLGQLEAVLIEEMKPNYLAPRHRTNSSLLDLVLKMGIELGDRVFIRQSRALSSRPDYSQTLQGYSGQTLLICSEYDLLCPIERHRQMAELLTNHQLVTLNDCGHLSTLESPAAVNQAMLKWLN